MREEDKTSWVSDLNTQLRAPRRRTSVRETFLLVLAALMVVGGIVSLVLGP